MDFVQDFQTTCQRLTISIDVIKIRKTLNKDEDAFLQSFLNHCLSKIDKLTQGIPNGSEGDYEPNYWRTMEAYNEDNFKAYSFKQLKYGELGNIAVPLLEKVKFRSPLRQNTVKLAVYLFVEQSLFLDQKAPK